MRSVRAVVLLAVVLRPLTGGGSEREGVVIDSVAPDGAAARGGLRKGDVLIGWNGARPRRFRSPFDVELAELEAMAAPHASVQARRDGAPLSVVLPAGEWKIQALPLLQDAEATVFEEGRQRASAGDPAGAEDRWRPLVESLSSRGDAASAAWLLVRLGDAFARATRLDVAEKVYTEAASRAESLHEARVVASVRQAEAVGWRRAGQPARSEAALEAARRLDEARPGAAGALALVLTQEARIASDREDYGRAKDLYQRALVLGRRVAPRGVAAATALNGLGAVAYSRGDIVAAERFYRAALDLRLRITPDGAETANILGNLGLVAYSRGDLAAAEALYLRCLALHEKSDPEGPGVGFALNYLAVVARNRGELEAADALQRRVVALMEKDSPRSVRVAGALNNLGNIAEGRKEWAEAESLHRRALEIRRALAPGGLDVAASLQNLGELSLERGDPKSAEPFYREALEIKERRAPGSLVTANALFGLGETAAALDDLAAAARFHEQALAVRLRLNPGSTAEAESRHALGKIQRRAGRKEEAVDQWRRAAAALDAQRGRIGGGDESQAAFAARFAPLYQDLMMALVDDGRAEEAFAVLERSRARTMLALLGERDLVFSESGPARRELQDVDAEYDRVQARLAQLSPERDAEKTASALSLLGELQQRRAALVNRLRRENPKVAALQQPEPLDLAGARAQLDPGTLLLAFAVGPERTILFAVADAAEPDGFAAFVLPLGESALRDRVLDFRALIEGGRTSTEPDPALLEQGRRLYADLFGPAQSRMARARRLLLSPDGPLHALPFAALRRGPPEQYLVEWKPMGRALSVALHAELRKRPRPVGGEPEMLAIGAPPPMASASAHPADIAAARATGLAPLPYAAEELRTIAGLFPSHVLLVGPAATEAAAKAPSRARYVHFACHSVLDRRHPLDSALVLAPPRGAGQTDNGLLQAWEVFESVRLQADLVTLSGCETALGREMADEGLVGLARAFHYAGARSVLASLWAISDRSTPMLMRAFYRGLRAGKPKDEALRAAQKELLGGEFAHPFHWAAFVLSGDPQ